MNSHKEDIQDGAGQGAAHAFSQQPAAEGKLTVTAAEGKNETVGKSSVLGASRRNWPRVIENLLGYA